MKTPPNTFFAYKSTTIKSIVVLLYLYSISEFFHIVKAEEDRLGFAVCCAHININPSSCFDYFVAILLAVIHCRCVTENGYNIVKIIIVNSRSRPNKSIGRIVADFFALFKLINAAVTKEIILSACRNSFIQWAVTQVIENIRNRFG